MTQSCFPLCVMFHVGVYGLYKALSPQLVQQRGWRWELGTKNVWDEHPGIRYDAC